MAKKSKKNPQSIFIKDYSRPVTVYAIIISIFFVILIFGMKAYIANESLDEVPSNADYKNSNIVVSQRVDDLMSRMTQKEKVGQMALVDKNSLIKPEDIKRYNLGALLSGAGAKPDNNTAKGWADMITGYQDEAKKTRLQIPLFYGIDANHGHTNIPGAAVFPHAIGLGAANDTDLTARVAAATSQELAATGVNWSYSPSLDAPKDIRWGRVYEAFSDDPELIKTQGVAFIKGTQAKNQNNLEVMATAKHYLATGDQVWGESDNKNFKIDQGRVKPDEQRLENEYLPPFKSAIDAGVPSVMVALHKWDDQTIVTNKYLVNDKLKNELGFKGFVVSDWYGVYERAGDYYSATVKAINSGLDMAMLPFDYKSFEKDMLKALKNGDIKQERVDDSVRRILTAKFEAGLFDQKSVDYNSFSQVGSNSHREIAREAVAKSAVLLKNDNVLPLSANQKILLSGSGANNVGRQSGAWTVEWQGIDGNWLPGSTSIKQAFDKNDNNITFSEKGNFTGGVYGDIGVVVVSEKPYAEGWGDNPKPEISTEDMKAIKLTRERVNKLVIVIVSGRPLILDQAELAKWDGLVAVWLPGSEGDGVADVLFGKKEFKGKLPITWPANTLQLPIQANGQTADFTPPLFPRYYSIK